MTPVSFTQSNHVFGSPSDLPGSCIDIEAHLSVVEQGIFEGTRRVVVAWKPTDEDLKKLLAGASIYLTCMGGLPPHFMSTSFEDAVS